MRGVVEQAALTKGMQAQGQQVRLPHPAARGGSTQSSADLAHIDWNAPWLALWRERGLRVAQRVAAGASCAEALNAEQAAPRRFVAQSALPEGMAYEQFIADAACVPTRDGLHDFFNGLCWMRFPQAKARLNALQAAQIAADGVQRVRGPARDALTLVDENVAILQAPDALWQALCEKNWAHAFGPLRPLWHSSRLVLFGHALLEKLVAPRKPITAHVLRATPQDASLEALDAWLADYFRSDTLAAKPFAHLPVLGVPGWWPANEDPGFYDDAAVFRPPRAAGATKP